MKKVFLGFVITISLLCAGCSSAHRHLSDKAAVLGHPFMSCTSSNGDCEMIRNLEVPGAKPGTTSQLTPPGCALHILATLGHVPWECRNEKSTRGRWLWHKGKDPHVASWTDSDWEIAAKYYGKPYLEAPEGWHWVCRNMPREKCYIDKNTI